MICPSQHDTLLLFALISDCSGFVYRKYFIIFFIIWKTNKYFSFSCRNISLDINSSASIEFLVKVNWKPSLVFSVTIPALLTYFWQHLERKFWPIRDWCSPCDDSKAAGWNNFYNEMQICEMTKLSLNNLNNLCQELCRERRVIQDSIKRLWAASVRFYPLSRMQWYRVFPFPPTISLPANNLVIEL